MATTQKIDSADSEDTVCVATKRIDWGPNNTVVLPDAQKARRWLCTAIADDPTMGEYQWTEYKKLVCEPTDDPNYTVYGTIETVPFDPR